MKTRHFLMMATLAVGMAMTSMMMTSCAKEDNPVNDEPEYDDETLRYVEGILQTGTDELLLFQNHIVEIDSLGNFVCRVHGMPLDPADSNILSIGVEDLAEARAIFEGWLPDEPVMTENAPNVLTFYPKDEEGNTQGEIYFTPSDADDLIAKVTFSESTNLLHFTTIRFIPNSLWPDIPGDADSPYKLWQLVYLPKGIFQCIRESGNGKTGLLAYVSGDLINPMYRLNNGGNTQHGATESISKEVSLILRDKWHMWFYYGSRDVWTDKRLIMIVTNGYYTIDLTTGKFTYYDGGNCGLYYFFNPGVNTFPQLYVKQF